MAEKKVKQEESVVVRTEPTITPLDIQPGALSGAAVPTPPPVETPPTTLNQPLHIVTDEPEPAKPALTSKTVRSLVHLDDTNDTGKSYRPGHIIEGWTQEKIDHMVAEHQVEVL